MLTCALTSPHGLFRTTLLTALLLSLLVALSLTLAALATSRCPAETHQVDFILTKAQAYLHFHLNCWQEDDCAGDKYWGRRWTKSV
jgi:hypothetical protein